MSDCGYCSRVQDSHGGNTAYKCRRHTKRVSITTTRLYKQSDIDTLLTTLQTEVEKLRQHGDFAGAGVMRILGMTNEELTHDSGVYDQALDDVLAIINKLRNEGM